ncbi:hypothetical protein NHG97_29380 [Pseudomonas corrugata]|uniref:hypothetical protein n=1 Tax=Pseudomonas corrugata TaxID=47879 RepID=UPI0028C3C298|nr:hypothetical protein [Pseudomonas corrugata]MDU9042807.1 hypothetical protein [Pseudomonas corrugata]
MNTVKPETRKATMRHTATLEVESNYHSARAWAGSNLAGAVEGLLDWQELGAEKLCDELRKLLVVHQDELQAAKASRLKMGTHVDAAKFADEV